MKRIFTKFSVIAVLLCSTFSLAYGQIPDDSPIPVTVLFEGENVNLEFNTGSYGTYTSDWGDTLSQTVSAPLAWAFTTPTEDTPSDSLACSEVETDLTGKIALIRRGVCFFSDKLFYTQQAGAIGAIILNDDRDDDAIINMAPGDSLADVVTIPGIFLNRASELPSTVVPALDNGEEIIVTFEVSTMSDGFAADVYQTPLAHVRPMDSLSVSYFNVDTVITPPFDLIAEIVEPDGDTIRSSVSVEVPPLSDTTVLFESYTPAEVGEYTVIYSNSINDEVLETGFAITDLTFSAASTEILESPSTNNNFIEDNLLYHVATIVKPGPVAAVTPLGSFGLANPDELYLEGEVEANQFRLVIYDADADQDGVNDIDPNFDNMEDVMTFDEFPEVASGVYTLNGTEQPRSILFAELLTSEGEVPELQAGGIYYLVVEYNGAFAGLGISPAYLQTPANYRIYDNAAPIFTSQVFDDGNGNAHVVSLHLDGFVNAEEVDQVLDADKVKVSPNLTSDILNVQFDLTETADEVRIGMMDMQGRTIESVKLQGVQKDTHQFNVEQLPAGTYFLSILTPEGYRAEKFVVTK